MRRWTLYKPRGTGYLPDAAIKDPRSGPSLAVETQVAQMSEEPTMIGVECANCGARFLKRRYYFERNERRGRRHFCTQSCSAIGQKKDRP